MNCILNWISNNIPEIFAIIMGIVSFGFSFWKYKSQLATLTRHFIEKENNDYIYKARITLLTNSEQIELCGYRLFKKKFLFYRYYKDPQIIEIIIPKEPITGYYDIDLSTIKNLKIGKYKLLIFINRHPKKLKLKFELPVKISRIQ